MHVVVWPSFAGEEVVSRLDRIPGTELTVVRSEPQLLKSLEEAEVLVLPGPRYTRAVAAAVAAHPGRLRWIQLLTAGYETLQKHGVPAEVGVASAGDAWSPAVAEHAMALFLALVRRVPGILASQAKHEWDGSASAAIDELHGRSMAVVGFGSIGRHVAVLARAFGMRVIGVSRSATASPEADEMYSVDALRQALGRSSAVLVSVPFTSETARMIGAGELACCQPGSVLVNVARGGVLDHAALASALRHGPLAGAAIDVTDPEPLPREDPLWDCPNLIVSPHVAGAGGAAARARMATVIGDNVARMLDGNQVEHLIPTDPLITAGRGGALSRHNSP